jgi:hypothetical protein
MNRHRAGSGIGVLALALAFGSAMALSSVSVASAGQYKATSHHKAKHGKAKPKVASGSNGARSVAAALVADFDSGKISSICSLALPSARSACNSEVKGELDGSHPSFPKVRLSSVSVTGNEGTYTMSCTGAGYCGNFAGRNVSQAMIKQGGKWYLVNNSANFGNFALSINSSSGTSHSGNGKGAPNATRSLTAFCHDVRNVTGDVASLLASSTDGGQEVPVSVLDKAASAAEHLANEAPSEKGIEQDAKAVANDLKSPNNQNSDLIGDDASLETDYDTDCPGGAAYTGGSGNSGNSGGFGNSGNSGGSGNSGNSGGFGNSGNSGGSGNSGNSGF